VGGNPVQWGLPLFCDRPCGLESGFPAQGVSYPLCDSPSALGFDQLVFRHLDAPGGFGRPISADFSGSTGRSLPIFRRRQANFCRYFGVGRSISADFRGRQANFCRLFMIIRHRQANFCRYFGVGRPISADFRGRQANFCRLFMIIRHR
jgi:hypothetical protein